MDKQKKGQKDPSKKDLSKKEAIEKTFAAWAGEPVEEDDKKTRMEKQIAMWAGGDPNVSGGKQKLPAVVKQDPPEIREARSALREAVLELQRIEQYNEEQRDSLSALTSEYVQTLQEIEADLVTMKKLRNEIKILNEEERKLNILQDVIELESADSLKGILLRLVEDNPNLLSQVEQHLKNLDAMNAQVEQAKSKSKRKKGGLVKDTHGVRRTKASQSSSSKKSVNVRRLGTEKCEDETTDPKID